MSYLGQTYLSKMNAKNWIEYLQLPTWNKHGALTFIFISLFSFFISLIFAGNDMVHWICDIQVERHIRPQKLLQKLGISMFQKRFDGTSKDTLLTSWEWTKIPSLEEWTIWCYQGAPQWVSTSMLQWYHH